MGCYPGGAECLNPALLPKKCSYTPHSCQPAIGNVWQWVCGGSPGMGQELTPALPMLRAGFAVTLLMPWYPREPDAGWGVGGGMLCSSSSWLVGPLCSVVSGTSIQHDWWDLCAAWLWGTCTACTHLPIPPCWKKGDEDGKARQGSLRAFDALSLAGGPRLCNIATASDLAMLI